MRMRHRLDQPIARFELRTHTDATPDFVLSHKLVLSKGVISDASLRIVATLSAGQWTTEFAATDKLIISNSLRFTFERPVDSDEVGSFEYITLLRSSIWLPDRQLIAYIDVLGRLFDRNGLHWQRMVLRQDDGQPAAHYARDL